MEEPPTWPPVLAPPPHAERTEHMHARTMNFNAAMSLWFLMGPNV